MSSLVDKVDFSILENALTDIYTNSKFEKYKRLGPKQKGAISERLLSDILMKLGMDVQPPLSSDHDRIVNGKKVEMKSATIVNNTLETLSFLQIRPKQDLDIYLMSAILPNDIESYWVEKEVILQLIEEGKINLQHGGKKGNSGTYCWYPTLSELKKIGTSIQK